MDATLSLRLVGYGGIRIAKTYKWQKLFKACDVAPMNSDTQHRYGFVGPALFNGGMVGLDVGKGAEFCRAWEKYTDHLWHSVLRPQHRYFSEQTALAMAVHALKWDYGLQPFPAWMCRHYGNWKAFGNNQRYKSTTATLFKQHPAILKFLRCRIATKSTQDTFKDRRYG